MKKYGSGKLEVPFKPGDIVFIQGMYKAKVVEDCGNTVFCIALEGYAPHQKGKTFTYGRDLIERTKRAPSWKGTKNEDLN